MTQYTITGMSCAACVAHVEKAVKKVSGVTACSVSLLTNSMSVEGSAPPEAIISAVKAAGYGAALKGGVKSNSAQGDELKDTETPKLLARLIISLIFLAALMYISMGHAMWGWRLPSFFDGNPVAVGISQLILAAIIMVINQRFFVSGFKSLWRRAPNMDALVAIGASAAFIYSTVALYMMTVAEARGDSAGAMKYLHELYFESAGTILTLITLGKTLEARSKGKTTDALKGLMKFAPKTAVVERNGEEIAVPVAEVKKGDVYLVRPGENIPVDGVVIDGASAVDESTLTGESIPVDKNAGCSVSQGTLNQSGFLRCEATRVGEDTTLAQIIRMVESAAATKAPIAKVADKVSGIFVPAVMGVALVTFIIWLIVGRTVGFSLARAISVLVISCPCALGLATPVAVMVGSGKGAKNGILFKTAAALEATGRAEFAVLDKTGTITKGEPEVVNVYPTEGLTESEFLTVACSLENRSEHPLARAIMKRAAELDLSPREVDEFKVFAGSGLTAKMGKDIVCGGNLGYISSISRVPESVKDISDRLAENGKTPLYFAKNGEFLGIIAVADAVKEDGKRAISELKGMGIRVVMLTGDNERTARAIGREVGVDEVIAGVLPDGKESVIRRLKERGKVVMVGDGINDAPALTSADVGIAIGAGTDVAVDAADVVLMKSALSDVPAAIRLSRATLRNVHENLFWAFIYNSLGIPLAAGAFIALLGWELNPMFGAAAMSLSSFCVVMNALRLNFFNPHNAKRDRKIKKRNKNKVKDQNIIKEKEKTKMTKTLKIEGMMCGHCEATVKGALEAVEGVESAIVSHEKGTAVVTFATTVSDDMLKRAVEAKDYKVISIE